MAELEVPSGLFVLIGFGCELYKSIERPTYSNMAGWPSGLRRCTQENSSRIEFGFAVSKEAWVQIPLLSQPCLLFFLSTFFSPRRSPPVVFLHFIYLKLRV